MTLPSPSLKTARPAPGPGPGAAAFAERLAVLRAEIDRALEAWLAAKRRTLAGVSPESAELVDEVARLVAGGGKRLRPALVELAYRASGGRSAEAPLRLGLATELLHTYLLIHDDVMDRASLRRGRATTHSAFAERLEAPSRVERRAEGRGERRHGDAGHFGLSVAILAGDLAHSFAVELSRPGRVGAEGTPAEGDPAAVAAAFEAMCEEVIGGQYLEMLLPHRAEPTEDELLRVLRLKSGRYTVARPAELGALLAGAGEGVVAGFFRWGEAAGEAFQLQDDVLGTFGDSGAVGKPVASDLAEGKHTFLVHHALEGAAPEDREWLRTTLGRGELTAAELERARAVLRDSGGLAAVQDRIEERLDEARRALDDLPLPAPALAPFASFLDYLRERDR
ncbi:MAG TPA: polyprenyl synthetase family protein [Thermoanaerobaculia bacterium]|nr:polyprenyl synthetase family protein [Thermoanaerobaculia bacterium]